MLAHALYLFYDWLRLVELGGDAVLLRPVLAVPNVIVYQMLYSAQQEPVSSHQFVAVKIYVTVKGLT